MITHRVVGQGNTEDIAEEEKDLVLGVVDGGSRDIAVNATDLYVLAWRRHK